MRLSTSTNMVAFTANQAKNSLPFCIEACAKGGYKVLDVNWCEAMNPNSRLRENNWEFYVHEIGELAAKWGVTFSQSHLPYYDVFANTDTSKAECMETLIHRSILASARLGVSWAVTHPCTVYGSAHFVDISLQKNLQYFSKHIETAQKVGVGIALENEFEYKTKPYQRIFCSSIFELCQLVDAFATNSVGACYDFGHAHLCGGFHRQNINLLSNRLKAVHVQDNCGVSDDHVMPFFGTINWEEAIAGLADISYQGDLTYEIQEFGRYLPNDLKHTVVDLSLIIGKRLMDIYDTFKQQKNTPIPTI